MQVNLSERPCRYEVSYDVKNVYRYENEKLFFSTLLKKQKKNWFIEKSNMKTCLYVLTHLQTLVSVFLTINTAYGRYYYMLHYFTEIFSVLFIYYKWKYVIIILFLIDQVMCMVY